MSNDLKAALERAADVMRRADPEYCEAHGVELVTDLEWDEAVQGIEDAIEALIGNAGALH